MSSVSVVTNALRLRRFKRPASARRSCIRRCGDASASARYLAGIGVVAHRDRRAGDYLRAGPK